jgi:hypothetical protein
VRLHRLLLVVLAALAAAALLAPSPARAQEPGQRTVDGSIDTSGEPLPEPHIIPRPNEGHEPIDSGDRGGSLQLGLLALMVVAVGGGVAYVVHESRKARAAQQAQPQG